MKRCKCRDTCIGNCMKRRVVISTWKLVGAGWALKTGVIDQPRVSGIPGGESSGGVYTRILSNLSFISHTNWNTCGYNGLEIFSFLEDLENRPTNKN